MDVAMQSVDGTLSCEFTRVIKGKFTWYNYLKPVEHVIDYTSSIDSPEYYLYLAWGEPYPGVYRGIFMV